MSMILKTIIPSACPLQDRRKGAIPLPAAVGRRLSPICCNKNASNSGVGGDEPRLSSTTPLVDRRDMLVALGGLYGAAGNMALAKPIQPPDLAKCNPAKSGGIEPGSPLLKCCPPYSNTDIKIVDYDFPKTRLRVRRPAHEIVNDEKYMKKYKAAVKAMKCLDDDDPWNFYQQAKVHCAYCNDAYYQVENNDDKATLNVHGSWIFLPWHRYFLHFYERILGKLIDDDTFALPFWNFDSPKGMTFPSLYNDPSSPLYNCNRNMKHIKPPTILDYRIGDNDELTDEDRIQQNLIDMRGIFDRSTPLAELFMGDPLRAGEEVATQEKGTGRLESFHNAIHQWVGMADSPHLDMGNLATASRDSVFFCLHANVDRLWHIYRTLRGNRVEFKDPDWLDSAFIFYNENRQVVRVKIRDTLNLSNFCYTYEEVPIPWLGKVSRPKKVVTMAKRELAMKQVTEFGTEPRKLESTIQVIVPRPTKNRSKSEKEEKVEVLYIKGIVSNTPGSARFDVYVSKPYGELAGQQSKGELVGSYVKLLSGETEEKEGTSVKGKAKAARLRLGITYVLEELDADDAENLVVTLVPRYGDVTVGGVAIELLDTDTNV